MDLLALVFSGLIGTVLIYYPLTKIIWPIVRGRAENVRTAMVIEFTILIAIYQIAYLYIQGFSLIGTLYTGLAIYFLVLLDSKRELTSSRLLTFMHRWYIKWTFGIFAPLTIWIIFLSPLSVRYPYWYVSIPSLFVMFFYMHFLIKRRKSISVMR